MDEFFKWIKAHLKVVVTVIIAGIPIVVYFLSVLPVFPSGENNDWAGFWGGYLGAVIGAFTTMLVFYFTIKKSDKDRKEENRLQVLPVMLYDISNIRRETPSKQFECIFEIDRFEAKANLCFNLRMKNIGLGTAQEIELSNWTIDRIYYLASHKANVLLLGQEIVIDIRLDFPSDKDYDKEIGQRKYFSRSVKYKDIFGNLYEQIIPFQFFYLRYFEDNEQKEKIEVTIDGLQQAKLIKRASE